MSAGYSFGKTEWVMSRKVKKLFLGEAPPPRAALDSKFEVRRFRLLFLVATPRFRSLGLLEVLGCI